VIRWTLLLLFAAPGLALAQPIADPDQPEEPAPAADPEPEPDLAPPEPDVPETGTPPAEPAPVPAEAPGEEPPALPEPEPDAEVSARDVGRASFMDVRLNITLTNENVFAQPGETIPSVPGWRFGVPNSLGTLFFDNYDTRFSGYETMSHAVLYKRFVKEEYDVEGALVLRVNDLAEDTIDLSDAGSYIRVGYNFSPPTNGHRSQLSLTAFPTSSDRFRLGYSWRLSWGGSPEYRRSRSAVPGIKVQYDAGRAYTFVGAKSAVVLDRETAEEEAVLAFLGGAGVDVTDMFRVEVNGGYYDRGGNELQDVIRERVQLFGGSVQLALHKGEPVGSSVDYALYRNDPERIGYLFLQEKYPGGLTWLVKSEATALAQTLKDPEVSGGTTRQIGLAADINGRVKYNRTRAWVDLQYRDLAFILHSTPSLPTFSDFPEEYEQTGNLFAAVGADHNFKGTGLTLGAVFGVDLPATLTTPTGAIPGDMVGGSGESVAVIRNEGDITILPEGEEALPQFATKIITRIDFAAYFAGLVDVYFALDPNQTRLVRDDADDLFVREFGEQRQLGFNFTLQAKF
jgi:hypothetical protein